MGGLPVDLRVDPGSSPGTRVRCLMSGELSLARHHEAEGKDLGHFMQTFKAA